MADHHGSHHHSLETADCLKAVGVFKRWNALLLLMLAVCLLLLQASFYLVDQGYVTITGQTSENNETAAGQPDEANPVLQLATKWLPMEFISKITFERLKWTIGLVNTALIPVATLYCLTLLSSLNISLHSGLGGMKHITRAFLLSVLMLVLLLPWQKVFGSVVTGAMFTADEMAEWYSSKAEDTPAAIPYYLRFSGYGLLMLLLLILSQLGSLLWAMAISRRLNVIQMERRLISAQRPASSAELSEDFDAF